MSTTSTTFPSATPPVPQSAYASSQGSIADLLRNVKPGVIPTTKLSPSSPKIGSEVKTEENAWEDKSRKWPESPSDSRRKDEKVSQHLKRSGSGKKDARAQVEDSETTGSKASNPDNRNTNQNSIRTNSLSLVSGAAPSAVKLPGDFSYADMLKRKKEEAAAAAAGEASSSGPAATTPAAALAAPASVVAAETAGSKGTETGNGEKESTAGSA